ALMSSSTASLPSRITARASVLAIALVIRDRRFLRLTNTSYILITKKLIVYAVPFHLRHDATSAVIDISLLREPPSAEHAAWIDRK
ncbi:MAG: hypothetical protein AB7U61_04295, partial [Methylocystis sp.]